MVEKMILCMEKEKIRKELESNRDYFFRSTEKQNDAQYQGWQGTP